MDNKWLKIGLVVGGILVLYVAVIIGARLMRGDTATTSTVPTAPIEFWNVFDKTADIQPLLTAFTEQYGIKVNYRSFPDANSYREELLAALASGSGPDVFALHRGQLDKYRALLAPLPAADLGYTADNVRRTFVDVVAKDVLRTPLPDKKTGKATSGEEVLALPLYVDSLGLFYNAAMYKNILAKPSGMPAETWEGVRGEAIRLATRSGTDANAATLTLGGIALGRGDNVSRAADIFSALLLQHGVTTLTTGTTQVRFTQPVSDTLDFLTSFARSPSAATYAWNKDLTAGSAEREIDAFARGKVAMIVGYSYYFDSIESRIAQIQRQAAGTANSAIQMSNVRAMPLPQLTDPRAGGTRATLADYFALTTGKNSKLVHEGWQLILFLTNHDNGQTYFTATKKPSARRDLLEAESADVIRGAFATQAVYADTLAIPDSDKYTTTVKTMLDTVSDGKLMVSAAVSAGETYLNCLLGGTTDCTFGGGN